MVFRRSICVNADCHWELFGSAEEPSVCPGCGASVITACPKCGSSLAAMKDPWPISCDECGAKIRQHLDQSYHGVM